MEYLKQSNLMETDIEKQLHEQYAVNNNAYLSSVISFLVGLFGAIGAYGYVLIYAFPDYGGNIVFSPVQLFVAMTGAMFVLGIISCICMYQGIAQRREQFITYAIRVKHIKNVGAENSIFPQKYSPFDKHGLDMVQGLYGEFLKIVICVQLLIFVSAVIYLLQANCVCCCCSCVIITICVCLCILFAMFQIVYFFCQKEKYKKTEIEFEHKIIQIKKTNNQQTI